MDGVIAATLSIIAWLQLAGAGFLSVTLAEIRRSHEFQVMDALPLVLLTGAAACALIARRLRRNG